MTSDYVKHYAGDWAKAKVHEALGQTLDKTVLTYRKPRDVRVLHFPGIDMAETERVYLARGILPRNIVGLERDKSVYAALRARNSEMQIYRGTLEDWVEQQPALAFEVISLDYTSAFSQKQDMVLRAIKNKQKCNSFILHCANLLRREKSVDLYKTAFCSPERPLNSEEEEILAENTHISYRIFTDVIRLRAWERRKADDKNNFLDEKRIAYSSMLRTIFGSPESNIDMENKIFRFFAGDKYENHICNLEHQVQNLLGDHVTIDRENPSFLGEYSEEAISAFIHLYIDFRKRMFEKTSSSFGIGPLFANALEIMLVEGIYNKRTYTTDNKKRYTYVSETGSPMIGDISFLRNNIYYQQEVALLAKMCGYPSRFKASNRPALDKQLLRIFSTLDRDHLSPEDIYTEREFFGNSSKPVLTKKRFIAELEIAQSREEIPAVIERVKQTYRGWQGKPLPQWQAHFTMGTYRSQEMGEESEEDQDITKISEEEVYELFNSTNPPSPQEILSCWPTSFTLPRLRDMLANVTRQRNAQEATP